MSNPSDADRPGDPNDGWSPRSREQLLVDVKTRGAKLQRRRQAIAGSVGAVVLLLGGAAVVTQLPDREGTNEIAVSTDGDTTDEAEDIAPGADQGEDGDGSGQAPSVPAPTTTSEFPVITGTTTSTTAPPPVPANATTTTSGPEPCGPPSTGTTQPPDFDDPNSPVSTTTMTLQPCPPATGDPEPPPEVVADCAWPEPTGGTTTTIPECNYIGFPPPVDDVGGPVTTIPGEACPRPDPASITTTTVFGCVPAADAPAPTDDTADPPSPETAPPSLEPSTDAIVQPGVVPTVLADSDGQGCCPMVEVYAQGPTIVVHDSSLGDTYRDGDTYFDDAGNVIEEPDLTQASPVSPLEGTPDEALEPLPGFEPFNDPRYQLNDGRLLVRGRLDADAEALSTFGQMVGGQEPDSLTETFNEPVRLFIYDPEDDSFEAVSHFPETRPYSTATSEGSGPDVVLEVYVVPNEAAVVYTVGFSGAAYDIPYELRLAPIPSR